MCNCVIYNQYTDTEFVKSEEAGCLLKSYKCTTPVKLLNTR